MAWSSFEKDKLLAEDWRKFLQEEEQIVFGINSDKKVNPESLLSFLEKNQAAIGLSNEQVQELLNLMLARTKEDDVVLEAIGGPQRDARTFSSDTTTKLNALINTFRLNPANKKKLEKVLNRWAKLNTVTFEPGEAATPAMVTGEPDEAEGAPTPAAEPKKTSRGKDYEPYGATDATPQKRADNLVVTQKGNFDAETGSPISEEGRDSIIKQIAAATKETEFYEAYQKLANSKFSDNDKKDSFNTAFKNRDYEYLSGFGAGSKAQQIIRQKFIDLFLSDETKPDNSQQAPAQTAVDLLNKVDTPAADPVTPELFKSFVTDFSSFIRRIKATQKGPLREITKKELAKRFGLNSSNKFDRFFNKNPKYRAIRARLTFMATDGEAVNSFLRSFEQVAKSLPADTPAKPEPKAAATPTEPVPQAAPAPEPEPEPAGQEEEPREKSPDPRSTRRATKRIKNYYNSLEIVQKISSKFNNWKEKIETIDQVKSIEKFEFDKTGERSGTSVERFDPEKNGLYLITLKNGEQFGLPKHTRDVSTLGFGFKWDGQIGNNAPFKEVTKLAKIKDGKIIEKGEITWGERGSTIPENILNESLMLRWKQLAGIL
jgi:hypothetical protein